MNYDDPEWIELTSKSFESWWLRYMRKPEDKTDLAKSIALDAWLACREQAEEESY